MEHMELCLWLCLSVKPGTTSFQESWGSVMCTNTPSQLCCLLLRQQTAHPLNPAWGLWRDMGGCPELTPVCLTLRCPLPPTSPESLEKHFPPKVHSKLVCAGTVPVGQREQLEGHHLSMHLTQLWAEKLGFASTFIFRLIFLQWSLKNSLLSPLFAVSPFWVVSSTRCCLLLCSA